MSENKAPAVDIAPKITPSVLQTPLENSQEKAPGVAINSVDELITSLEAAKKMLFIYTLKNDVSISEFHNGYIKMAISDKVSGDFLLNLQKFLQEKSGITWEIETVRGSLGETIAQKEKAKDEQNKKNVSDLPLVKAILAEFSGAKIETLTRKINKELADEVSDSSFEDNDNPYFEEDN